MNKYNGGITLFRGGIIFSLIVSLWPVLMGTSQVYGTVKKGSSPLTEKKA